MKYVGIILVVICALSLACGEKPSKAKKVSPALELKQPAITDQGVDAVKSRLVAAANLVLKYAETHGEFPKATDSLELRDTLRREYGAEPSFELLWVSHNGKALILYNQSVAGKRLDQITDKDKTWLLKDPVGFSSEGYVIAYCNGSVDTRVEKPVGVGVTRAN